MSGLGGCKLGECPWKVYFLEDQEEWANVDHIVMLVVILATPLLLNRVCKLNVAGKYKTCDSVGLLYNFVWFSVTRMTFNALSTFDAVKAFVQNFMMANYIFGFLETILAVAEVESLTIVCIERYVVAKYIALGRPILKEHYVLFHNLCTFFSTLYTIPTLFGIGRFGYDFFCSSFTVDMILPDNWQRYMIVSIYLLRSIKPFIFMIVMLIRCRKYENTKSEAIMKEADFKLTELVIWITVTSLILWTPLAVFRGWVIFSQLVFGQILIAMPIYHYMIRIAYWMNSFVPLSCSIIILFFDSRHREQPAPANPAEPKNKNN